MDYLLLHRRGDPVPKVETYWDQLPDCEQGASSTGASPPPPFCWPTPWKPQSFPDARKAIRVTGILGEG